MEYEAEGAYKETSPDTRIYLVGCLLNPLKYRTIPDFHMKKTLSQVELATQLDLLTKQSQVVPLVQLLSSQAISCVDGRNFTGVVGAPGGNAGLFLEMLAAYELHTETQLSEDQIASIFSAYQDTFGHFYMHSDVHALESLMKSLQERGTQINSIEQLVSIISSPPESLKPLLLELLPMPAHTGCGHIRLMLENQETYRIRPFLIQSFIKDFLLHFWEGDERLQFEILRGNHAEQAILNIHVQNTEGHTDIPFVLVAPQLHEIQVFINHPEVAMYMHRQHAAFMTEQGYIDESDQMAFIKVHAALHGTQLTATVQALGDGLPIFDVDLNESLAVQRVERLG